MRPLETARRQGNSPLLKQLCSRRVRTARFRQASRHLPKVIISDAVPERPKYDENKL